MAIDTSMFVADFAAGTYTKDQEVELKIHTGPAVVRDGYGQPVLESIRTGMVTTKSTGILPGYFIVKNSNWVDPVINAVSGLFSQSSLSETAQGYQYGQQVPLQVNSTWSVVFHFTAEVTTTAENSMVALINIDYPRVSAVKNPANESGIPATNVVEMPDVRGTNPGTWAGARWTTKTVDILKAGNRYLLSKIAFYNMNTSQTCAGFLRISGVASQSGLARIIPTVGDMSGAIKAVISSSETFVKGPMDLSALIYDAKETGGIIVIDWVKR